MSLRSWPALALVAGSLLTSGSAHLSAHPGKRPHAHGGTASRAVLVVGHPRPAKRVVVLDGFAHGTLDVNVKPRSTEVWVDGTLRGTADAFDGFPGKLHLRPGIHRLELVTPAGQRAAREIRIQAGVERNIGLDLR